jgi:hypothetical protein
MEFKKELLKNKSFFGFILHSRCSTWEEAPPMSIEFLINCEYFVSLKKKKHIF